MASYEQCAVEQPAVHFIHRSFQQNAEVSITSAAGNSSARRRKPGAGAQLS